MRTVLGIETSCDETACAVVRGHEILSSVVASQIELHARFGGVVPEIASRAHVEAILPIAERALKEAGVSLDGIDAVAATGGPGLVGALLVGLTFAKAVAYARGLTFVAVNHVAAHVYSCTMEGGLAGEFVALVASGGHTALYEVKDPVAPELLGSTIDDAAGEAFDKGASVLGLDYPGGPAIEKASRGGNPGAVTFPRSFMRERRFDFSFSGVKTALLYHVRGTPGGRSRSAPAQESLADLAMSYQEAVVEVLVEKLIGAAGEVRSGAVAACGGVARNTRLREMLSERAAREGLEWYVPPPDFCTDNAAMVASLGRELLARGMSSDLSVAAFPRLVRSPLRVGGKRA